MSLRWSPSAILSARTCPLQWYATYGPGRTPRKKGAIATNRALGIAQHAALQTAYECVRTSYTPGRQKMVRYLDEAVDALLTQWRVLSLPDDDALKAHAVAELGAVLESLPVPRPAAVLGVEERIEFTGRAGTPFVAILDLVLRTGPNSIHIRDWKRKSISGLPTRAQLLDDVQLCEQVVAASTRWPWARTVTVGLFSIVSAQEMSNTMPLERALYRLDGHEVTADRMETAREHPPVKSSACGNCHVRPQCPAFGHKPFVATHNPG